jgi:hypothetical protein
LILPVFRPRKDYIKKLSSGPCKLLPADLELT